MENIEGSVHKGHRMRMKRKLLDYGGRIFDTYELLEMLLYYVIPFKDTNPISKELLAKYGGLNNLLRANKKDLITSVGVKERCAEFIQDVGRVEEIAELSSFLKPKVIFDDYKNAGEFFVSKFDQEKDVNIYFVLLDNGMRMINGTVIPGNNFGSGAVLPKYFLDVAMKYGASYGIVGYTHRNSFPFPYEGDLVTGKLIKEELELVGVSLIEQYIVGGGKFIGINTDTAFRRSKSRELEKFLQSRKLEEENIQKTLKNAECELKKNAEKDKENADNSTRVEGKEELSDSHQRSDEEVFADLLAEYSDNGFFAVTCAKYLSKILSYSIKNMDTDKIASDLVIRYGSLNTILDRSPDELLLFEGMDENTVVLIKLIAFLTSRRGLDKFKFNVRHTDKEICEFATSLYTGLYVETVYLICLDEKENVISCEYIGEGTVNSSDVFPRRLAERAVKCGASYAIFSHNHPAGIAKASNEDIYTTARMMSMFRSFGIKLKYHIIVAERNYAVLKPDEFSGEVKQVSPKLF